MFVINYSVTYEIQSTINRNLYKKIKTNTR